MKGFLFFLCMMICAMEVSNASSLAEMICTEGEVTHTYHGESDNLDIIYIDGEVYNFAKEHTVGDISFTQYSKDSDPDELAFLQVDVYEDGDVPQFVKLVLLRHGQPHAKFGGLCKFED